MRGSLILILMLVFASCSRENRAPLLVTRYLPENQAQKSDLYRTVASSTPGKQCLRDLFSESVLRREIEELEAPYRLAEKVQGEWRHLDLSSLPVPQANFLLAYGDEVGDISNPERIDYSDCADIVCVFNKIYAQSSSLPGLVHYLWFLRMGHMLSLDNHVPRQESYQSGVYNDKSFDLHDYLFSSDELYGFWRLSHMLKSPHRRIPGLRQIQRIPKGEPLEEPDFRKACALSGSGGWTKLGDQCLVIDEEKDRGFFYPTIVHELSHHIDYEEGRRLYKATHRSHQPDYLKLAGFKLQEYRDQRGLMRVWKKVNGTAITDYAGVSPQENFAEAMAYFRIDGNMAKKKLSKEHLSFISKNYYQNQKFDSDSILSQWLKALDPEIIRLGTRAFIECTWDEVCLKDKEKEIELELRGKIKLEEAEGCRLLGGPKVPKEWKQGLRNRLSRLYKSHRARSVKDSQYLGKLRHESADSDKAAVEAIVECYGEEREQECYRRQVLGFGQELFPFEVIREKVRNAYLALVNSKSAMIKSRLLGLWGGCHKSPNDDASPSGDFFHLREGYLVSSIYNCINASLPDTLRELVRDFDVKSGKEELILTSELKAFAQEELKLVHLTSREKESQEFNSEDCGKHEVLPLYHLKKEVCR